MKTTFVLATLVLALGCGGGQSTNSKNGNLGQSSKGDDLDDNGATGTGGGQEGEGQEPETTTEPEKPADPVTFVIKNSGAEDLVFSTDKGWQPIIFAFSGKPPKAKPIIMFPKFCTSSCDAEPEERCPFCPEPEKVKEIRAAEKREIVAPGKTLEVGWDAEVFVYERTKGKRDGRTKRCDCYRKEPVAAETYTVRVCGLRVTKVAEERSKLQCVDGTMTLPTEEPLRVELDFPDPKGK